MPYILVSVFFCVLQYVQICRYCMISSIYAPFSIDYTCEPSGSHYCLRSHRILLGDPPEKWQTLANSPPGFQVKAYLHNVPARLQRVDFVRPGRLPGDVTFWGTIKPWTRYPGEDGTRLDDLKVGIVGYKLPVEVVGGSYSSAWEKRLICFQLCNSSQEVYPCFEMSCYANLALLTLSKQGKVNWASGLCILCWFPSMHATLQTFSHPQLRLITSSIAWTKHHVSAKLSWFFQTGFLRWGTDGDIISGIPVHPSTFGLTKLYRCFRTHVQISSGSVQVVGKFRSYTQHTTISAGHDRWELSFCGLDLSQGRVGRRRFCESHRWGRGCSIGMTPSPNPRTMALSNCKWKSPASHVPCSLGFFWTEWERCVVVWGKCVAWTNCYSSWWLAGGWFSLFEL